MSLGDTERAPADAGAAPAADRRDGGRGWLVGIALALPAALFVAAFLVVPIGNLGITSLWRTQYFQIDHDWNLDQFQEVLSKKGVVTTLVRSVWTGLVVATVTMVLAFPVSWYLRFRAGAGKAVLLGIIVTVLFSSYLVRIYAWRTLLGREGAINWALQTTGITDEPVLFFFYNRFAVVLTLVHIFLPFVILLLLASLEGLGDDVVEAARVLGARGYQTLGSVVVPIIARGAFGAFAFTFIPSERRLLARLGALARLHRNARRLHAGGLLRRPRRLPDIAMRAGGILLRVYVGLLIAFLLAPVVVIILFSFNRARSLSFPISALSLEWYDTAFSDPKFQDALVNSLVIGGAMLVVVAVIGTPAAWAIARHRFPGRAILLAVVLAPLTMPGLFIGVGLLTFFVAIGEPLSLRTVVIAHVVYTLGFYVLVASARFAGLDPAFDEAARTLGASRWQSLRLVTWPMVRPALLAALALCLALSLDEFVITFYVIGPENTLPIVIFSNVRSTVSPAINAIATTLLVASWISVALAALLARGFGRRRREEGLRQVVAQR
jgi:ABC-type spermidine/putrescine transport system permease subunit II